jgi:hypothetical protein
VDVWREDGSDCMTVIDGVLRDDNTSSGSIMLIMATAVRHTSIYNIYIFVRARGTLHVG